MNQLPNPRTAGRPAPGPALGPALALLILGAWLSTPVAHAAELDLPSGCVTAGSISLHEQDGPQAGFDAGRLELLMPGVAGTPSLHAAHLHVAAQGAAGSIAPAQLEQASSAAAAALLAAMSSHHEGGCTDAVLQQAAGPLAHALQSGGGADFIWSDVQVRSGSTRLGARRLALHLAGGPTLRLTAAVDGAISNIAAAALLPETLTVRASLPSAELPALLAASAGQGARVELTIEQLQAHGADTALDGHGQVFVAATREASGGEGELAVRGLDALIADAAAPGLERLRTALFLAKLVAHRRGDQADWTLSWQGGTLLVNNVPLPLR